MSGRHTAPRGRYTAPRPQDKGVDNSELYEQVEVVQPSHPAGNRYIETTFQNQSSDQSNTPMTAVGRKERKGSFKVVLIALTATLLLCLLVVSLVAVILYSPQVRTSSESAASVSAQTSSTEDLLSRIQRLEAQLEAKQTPNQTQAALSSLQEQQESFEATLTSQFKNMQNLVQSMSSVQNNSALTLTRLNDNFQDNVLLHALDNLTALRVKFDQLSSFDTSVTSQLISMQNLIQSITSAQNNLQQNLRSVDLYRGCTQNTRTCTMTTGSSNYYWRSCTASYIYINPIVSYSLAPDWHADLSCIQFTTGHSVLHSGHKV